jgi:5-hydroxyisourate hydrolase
MTITGHTDAGRLTTHVLDTTSGRPGSDLVVALDRLEGDHRLRLCEVTTNSDGRCDRPLLEGAELRPGIYEILFHVGDYFRASGVTLTDPPFLDVVPIRFGIADAGQHYHVPLLISPYAYSTYRGS